MKNFAVLMACYKNDNPLYLDYAIKSSLDNQTLKPSAYYVVLDGEVTEEIEQVLSKYLLRYNDIFKIIRCEVNRGLGEALKTGIEVCECEYVFRMDADDISTPNRFETMLEYIDSINDNWDVIGSYSAEFDTMSNRVISIRKPKLSSLGTKLESKRRCPVSHVTVLLRRSSVIKAGNYNERFPLYEDYYLWTRMLKENMIIINYPYIGVYVRTDPERYKRKANKKYKKSTFEFYKYLLNEGYINSWDYFVNVFVRVFVANAPNAVRRLLYERVIRNKPLETKETRILKDVVIEK